MGCGDSGVVVSGVVWLGVWWLDVGFDLRFFFFFLALDFVGNV
jgi:hypothetical protein